MARRTILSAPHREPTPGVAYDTVAWPAKNSSTEDEDPSYFDNLTSSIKRHLMPTLQMGAANTTLYGQLNQDALTLADKHYSSHM